MNVMEESLQKHREWKGKIEVCSRAKVNNAKDLTLAYTPGVAQPCLEIQKDPDLSYELTRRANLVAVITDGSAVLGLGNIGRSEERRVGKECLRLCRSRWSPYH